MRNPNPNLDKIKARLGSIPETATVNFPESIKTLLTKDIPHLLDVYAKAAWIISCNNVIARERLTDEIKQQSIENLTLAVEDLTDTLAAVGGEPRPAN